MVRQLTLRDHANGDKFWWFHKHLLVNSGILPQNFSVVGIFRDDWLYVKYANPAMAIQAVWGLPDLIIALCTYRTQPSSHCALTDRPGQPRVVLGAVHMLSRLGRERINSPTWITVIVFPAGSQGRAKFNPCVAPLACNAAASRGPGHSEERRCAMAAGS